jgi:xanthine dehydrogenase YagS FAD-binding subunit
VAPKPWRAHLAETVLTGAPATPETFARAAESELSLAEPLAGNAYKVALARNAIVDALADLAGTE